MQVSTSCWNAELQATPSSSRCHIEKAIVHDVHDAVLKDMKARLLDFYQAGGLTNAYEEEVGSWLAILLDAEEAHVRVPDRRFAISSLNCDAK